MASQLHREQTLINKLQLEGGTEVNTGEVIPMANSKVWALK